MNSDQQVTGHGTRTTGVYTYIHIQVSLILMVAMLVSLLLGYEQESHNNDTMYVCTYKYIKFSGKPRVRDWLLRYLVCIRFRSMQWQGVCDLP